MNPWEDFIEESTPWVCSGHWNRHPQTRYINTQLSHLKDIMTTSVITIEITLPKAFNFTIKMF